MNNVDKNFDWLAFLCRSVAILALTTWILLAFLRGGHYTGAVCVGLAGYIIMPIVAYLQTRYFNMVGMKWLVERVKRWTAGRASG